MTVFDGFNNRPSMAGSSIWRALPAPGAGSPSVYGSLGSSSGSNGIVVVEWVG